MFGVLRLNLKRATLEHSGNNWCNMKRVISTDTHSPKYRMATNNTVAPLQVETLEHQKPTLNENCEKTSEKFKAEGMSLTNLSKINTHTISSHSNTESLNKWFPTPPVVHENKFETACRLSSERVLEDLDEVDTDNEDEDDHNIQFTLKLNYRFSI